MSFGRLPRSSAAARPMADINMTPLIDVMLVLLVIFLVAAPLLGGALRLELPSSQAAAAPPAEPLRLSLDARGQAYWNGEAVGPQGLRERLKRLGREQPETELLLAIDRALPYGQVAALIEQLQGAGLSRVAFATSPAPSPATSPAGASR